MQSGSMTWSRTWCQQNAARSRVCVQGNSNVGGLYSIADTCVEAGGDGADDGGPLEPSPGKLARKSLVHGSAATDDLQLLRSMMMQQDHYNIIMLVLHTMIMMMIMTILLMMLIIVKVLNEVIFVLIIIGGMSILDFRISMAAVYCRSKLRQHYDSERNHENILLMIFFLFMMIIIFNIIIMIIFIPRYIIIASFLY